MKWLACFGAAAVALAQSGALLTNPEAIQLERRTVQLMESTGVAVPGLARAGAPALEDARASLAKLEKDTRNAGVTYAFLSSLRAYLAIADTVPKPYPFPEAGSRQFAELRAAVDRLDSHFRTLLEYKETQVRNPDPDNLARYADADERLGPASGQKPRVVFLGDSITDGWRLNEYFTDRDFVNRGISGQVTEEMLGRMQADVIRPQPKVMLVLAGTNDLARGVPVPAIEGNLTMIADLAEAHHIRPMFASVLPVSAEQSALRPFGKILELNSWLRSFCSARRFVYVDYYAAMVDKAGYLQADLSDDGLHPNAKGYRIMAPIALEAIDSLVKGEGKRKSRRPF